MGRGEKGGNKYIYALMSLLFFSAQRTKFFLHKLIGKPVVGLADPLTWRMAAPESTEQLRLGGQTRSLSLAPN